MANNTFFVFSSKGALKTVAVTPVLFEHAIKNNLYGTNSGREIHHQLLYGDLTTGEYPEHLCFPIIFHQFDGTEWKDVLELRFDGHCYLISDRFKDVLLSENISGWKSYPVQVYDKIGNKIKGYNGFTIIGRAGKIEKGCNSSTEPYLGQGNNSNWDSAQWDGSDLFYISPNIVACTERVKQVLDRKRIEGLSYRPLRTIVSII